MQCDGDATCKLPPHRAPRLIVPHKFRFGEDQLMPRRMMTLLHFCEQHRVQLDEGKLVQSLLTGSVRRDFERMARHKWPLGYTCDFEKARIEWVLVTTPEYRAFMAALGYDGVMGAAKLAPEQQAWARQMMGVKQVAG